MTRIVPLALALGAALSPLVAQGPRNASFTGIRDVLAASLQDEGGERRAGGSFGIDVPTAYYFRGIQYENQGLIVQPHLELLYPLNEGGGGTTVDLVLGTWSSLHSGPTGTGGGDIAWFETDFYVGVAASFSERWSASATYSWYGEPQNGEVDEEATFAVAYDDSTVWFEDYGGLQPAFVLGIETKGQADDGNDKGIYAQIGVEPTFALGGDGGFEGTLAVPLAVGMSLGDYYEDATGNDSVFGFLDLGVRFSTPLTMLPSRFGPWDLSLSLHLLVLGDTTEEFNQDDTTEWILSLGLRTTW